MKAYKGFDRDLECLGFQFEVGKEYEEQEVNLCHKVFYAYLAPLDVFRYYAPATSRFCEVEIEGKIKKSTDDSIIVGTKIKIIREISLSELIAAQKEQEERKDVRKVVSAGDFGTATAGDYGVATVRDWGVATAGEYGTATVGECGVATAGECGVATARDCSVATAGNYGTATAGDHGAAMAGDYGTAVSRGTSSTGEDGLCVARGHGCRVKGGLGSVLVIVEECKYNREIEQCKMAFVDGEKIKADTWYTLQDGEFSEVVE